MQYQKYTHGSCLIVKIAFLEIVLVSIYTYFAFLVQKTLHCLVAFLPKTVLLAKQSPKEDKSMILHNTHDSTSFLLCAILAIITFHELQSFHFVPMSMICPLGSFSSIVHQP